jgi:AcrR family transcriptional regulator
MNHIANRKVRQYSSSLRDEQAARTRERILDATGRVLATGVAGLTIPAIAREAGVSIPTVYRIFGTKRDLIDAIYPYAVRRARTGELKPPTSMSDVRDGVRILFERVDSFDDVDRAAVASPGAEEVRRAGMDARVAMARQAAAAIGPDLPDDDRERLSRLVILLTTSASARMLREHLGRSLDEAVDDAEWALRAAVAGSELIRSGR